MLSASYCVDLAAEVGLPAAVLVNKIEFLMGKSKLEGGFCFRSRAEIEYELGITSKMYRTAMRKLEERGYIEKEVHRRPGSCGTCTFFRLTKRYFSVYGHNAVGRGADVVAPEGDAEGRAQAGRQLSMPMGKDDEQPLGPGMAERATPNPRMAERATPRMAERATPRMAERATPLNINSNQLIVIGNSNTASGGCAEDVRASSQEPRTARDNASGAPASHATPLLDPALASAFEGPACPGYAMSRIRSDFEEAVMAIEPAAVGCLNRVRMLEAGNGIHLVFGDGNGFSMKRMANEKRRIAEAAMLEVFGAPVPFACISASDRARFDAGEPIVEPDAPPHPQIAENGRDDAVPAPDASDTAPEPQVRVDSAEQEGHEKRRPCATGQYDPMFEEIWELYPRKKGKKGAYSAYRKAVKDGVDPQAIKDGVSRYVSEIDANHTQTKYIKHGATWFSAHGWEDVPDTETFDYGRRGLGRYL